MGMVAVIEEREALNLGLGIPAGLCTVLAAGWYCATTSLELALKTHFSDFRRPHGQGTSFS